MLQKMIRNAQEPHLLGHKQHKLVPTFQPVLCALNTAKTDAYRVWAATILKSLYGPHWLNKPPWNRILPEKSVATHLVKELHAFYGPCYSMCKQYYNLSAHFLKMDLNIIWNRFPDKTLKGWLWMENLEGCGSSCGLLKHTFHHLPWKAEKIHGSTQEGLDGV
jgi:hypothetical protein